jgi:cytochrome c553/mono/diheme cytochrome c family protein
MDFWFFLRHPPRGPSSRSMRRPTLRKTLKWFGTITGGLLGLAAAAYLVIHVVSTFRINRKYRVTHETVDLPSGPEAIARGKHLAEAVGHCDGCHRKDFGGGVMIESPLLGRIAAPNLTRGEGGRGADLEVEDWVRVLRHGLDETGHPLLVMPSQTFQAFSREDLGAIIAYMRQVPPVDRDVGESHVGPLGRVLLVAGVAPLLPAEEIDHSAGARFSPAPGPTAEYGGYLAETAGCLHCHGPALEGTPSPAPGMRPRPALADLARRGWSEDAFLRAMRTGARPDGTGLSDEMPWKALGRMTDDELRAVWRFLDGSGPQVSRRHNQS